MLRVPRLQVAEPGRPGPQRDAIVARGLRGAALEVALGKVVEKGRKIAAHLLEVSEEDIEFAKGQYSVKGAPDKVKRWITQVEKGEYPQDMRQALYDAGKRVMELRAREADDARRMALTRGRIYGGQDLSNLLPDVRNDGFLKDPTDTVVPSGRNLLRRR